MVAGQEPLIVCENLVKIYKVADLEVVALQGLDLIVRRGARDVSIPKWYDLKPLEKRLFWLNFKVFCGIFQQKNRRWPMTRFY